MRIQSKPAGSKRYVTATNVETKLYKPAYSEIAKEVYFWVDGEDGRQYKISIAYDEARRLADEWVKTLPEIREPHVMDDAIDYHNAPPSPARSTSKINQGRTGRQKMKTFSVIFENEPWRNRSFPVRGICQFDILNPCWDNRPDDVSGQHWSSEKGNIVPACPACTAAAKQAA